MRGTRFRFQWGDEELADDLNAINSILYEHEAIRHYLRMLGNSVNEQQALFLQTIGESGAQHLPVLAEKQFGLRQALASLYDGVAQHEAHEEKVLSSLVGGLLMEGLKIEHRSIMQRLEQVKEVVLETEAEGLDRDELLGRNYEARRATDSIREAIDAHITKEDAILEILRQALEATA